MNGVRFGEVEASDDFGHQPARLEDIDFVVDAALGLEAGQVAEGRELGCAALP